MKSAGALILLLAVTVCYATSLNRKARQYNLKAASVLYDVKNDPANVYNNREYAYKVEPVVPSKTSYQEATYGCCPTKVPKYEARPSYQTENPKPTYAANNQYATPNKQYKNDQDRTPVSSKDKPYASNTYGRNSKVPSAYEINPSLYNPTTSYISKPSMQYVPADTYKTVNSNSYPSPPIVDYQVPSTPNPYTPIASYGVKPSTPVTPTYSYRAPGSSPYTPSSGSYISSSGSYTPSSSSYTSSSNAAYQVQKPPGLYVSNPSTSYNPSQGKPFTIAVYPQENTQTSYSSRQPDRPTPTISYISVADQYKDAYPSSFYPDNISPIDYANTYTNFPNMYSQQLQCGCLFDGANYVDDYYMAPAQNLVAYSPNNYQDGSRKTAQYDSSQNDYNRAHNNRKNSPVNKYTTPQNQYTVKYNQPSTPSYGYNVPNAVPQQKYDQSYSRAPNPSQYTTSVVYPSTNPGSSYTMKVHRGNSNQGLYSSVPAYPNANPSPVYKPANEKPYLGKVNANKPYVQEGSYSTAMPYEKQEKQYQPKTLTENKRIYATNGPYAKKTSSYLPPPTNQYKRTIDVTVEEEEAQLKDNATAQAATVETSTFSIDISTPKESNVEKTVS